MISKQKPTFVCFHSDCVVISVLPYQGLKYNKAVFWTSSLTKNKSFLSIFDFFNIFFEEVLV